MKFQAVLTADGIARLALLDGKQALGQKACEADNTNSLECPELSEMRYHPGEVLAKCVAEDCSASPPEQDAQSQCSTADIFSAGSQFSASSAQDSHESSPGCITPEVASPGEPELENEVLARPDPLPSVGSAGHAKGLCNPCGFVHKRGCVAGAACTFCHLCPPGCIEQLRKDRRKVARVSRQIRRMEETASWAQSGGNPLNLRVL